MANVCLNIELGEGDLCHRQSPNLADSSGAREIKVSKEWSSLVGRGMSKY